MLGHSSVKRLEHFLEGEEVDVCGHQLIFVVGLEVPRQWT